MSIPRPKLLSVLTVPAGGWDLRLEITDAGQFDTDVDITIPAGDYFMSADNQSDDFLRAIMLAAYTDLDALAAGGGKDNYNGSDANGKPLLTIDSSHKVKIEVGNGEEMRIDWTVFDGASIAAVLGFSSAAALDLDSGVTGGYQHAYGWYADEDGLLISDLAEDAAVLHATQSVAPAGPVTTQYIATRYRNMIRLQFLPRLKTWSRGVGYATASVDPYARNVPLECWWSEASQGRRFRYYRDSKIGTAVAEVIGTPTGADTTTLTDTGRSFTTDPQEHAGKILQTESFTTLGEPMRFYISSHTATVITVANSVHNTALNIGSGTFEIFDQRYGTYVLNTTGMGEFSPAELPRIDKYDIDIPVRKSVA